MDNDKNEKEDPLKEYLRNEWRYNSAPKYQHYFEGWYANLTDWQRTCFTAWMEGKMGPWCA
jgi:hypothetical protein